MLVCNVSLRPRRTAIAVNIAEAVTAVDATATGNVVFATLVDDPASVGEIVDAYLGAIMVEAASAIDAVTAGAAGVTLPSRSAMLMGVFINPGTSREANALGIMVNI